MDESYLTGEPFEITKTRGSQVISGAINGDSVLVIRTTRRAADSRYARIMDVMRDSERTRPQLRRLGDRLGAVYTPVALAIALAAWAVSGDATRFLAVLVIATPCPLLIAIPVAIVGSISLCARRAIIIKSPVVLEQIATCRTAIFDKTGTLTFGEPAITDIAVADGVDRRGLIGAVASLERYSKHPLARAVLAAARAEAIVLAEATEVTEPPGEGLRGTVLGRQVVGDQPKDDAGHGPGGGSAVAGGRRRPRMRGRDRRALCRDLAVSRRAASRQPLVRPAPGSQAPVPPDDDCLGRSRVGGGITWREKSG